MQTVNGTRKWFAETRAQWFLEHGVPTWFHGPIPRSDAENLLKGKPPGCFLVRVGESRIGYSLSYNAFDRCRHFMVDVQGNGQFVLVGAAETHRTLEELVKFHRLNPIPPFNEILTQPCGQKCSSQNDYGELFTVNKSTTSSDARCPNGIVPSLNPSGPSQSPLVQDIGWKARPAVPQRIQPPQNGPHVPQRARSCDVVPSQTCSVLSTGQNKGENRLYPLIPEEMKSTSFVEESAFMSSLYPWKNQMKKATSCDSLLLNQKCENHSRMSPLPTGVHFGKDGAALQQTSSNHNWQNNRHVNKPPLPAKILKTKVLPVSDKAIPATSNLRIPHDLKLTRGMNEKCIGASVPKMTAEAIYSEPDHGSGGGVPSDQITSSDFFRNQRNFEPNRAPGGQGMSALMEGREMEASWNASAPLEEYKRPPPFAPGF